MSKRKNRITVEAVRLPGSREEVNEFIEEIAMLQGKIATLESHADAQIADIRKDAADHIRPLKKRIETRVREIAAFCTANRETLTKGKTKTVTFPAGTCSWRTSGGKVVLKGVKDVLARVKKLAGKNADYAKFIRTKEEIDREAMLKDPERAALVEGVTIKKGEIFAIKPLKTDIEEMV